MLKINHDFGLRIIVRFHCIVEDCR